MNNKIHEHRKLPTPVKRKSNDRKKQKQKSLVRGFTNEGLDTSRVLGASKVSSTGLREDIEMEKNPRHEHHSNKKNDYDLADIAKDQMHHQQMVIERLVRKL